jgi:hypothetical protein
MNDDVVVVRRITLECLTKCFENRGSWDRSTHPQRRPSVEQVWHALSRLPASGDAASERSYQTILEHPQRFYGLAGIFDRDEAQASADVWNAKLSAKHWKLPTGAGATLVITNRQIVSAIRAKLEECAADYGADFNTLFRNFSDQLPTGPIARMRQKRSGPEIRKAVLDAPGEHKRSRAAKHWK